MNRRLSWRRALAVLALSAMLAGFAQFGAGTEAAVIAQGPLPTASATSALPSPTQTPAKGDAGPAPFAAGQVVVGFAPGASAAQQQRAVAGHAARDLPGLRAAVLSVPPGQEADVVAALRRAPGVRFAEPNYLAQSLEVIPNDPDWTKQYGPQNIQAPAAWEITTGSAAVTIAVIDSGVHLQHPDLAAKIWVNPGEDGLDENGLNKRANGVDDDYNGLVDDWRGWDFVNQDNNPRDDFGHGTHVAGIAAAATNNGLGMAGVSWGARIMPIKVLGAGGFGTYADVASGIAYAADRGAQVINLSLGGTAESALLEQAVNYAHAQGSLVIAAAGNAPGLPVNYPAAYDNALAVASVDALNNRSSFSTYGPQVDIAGPGSSIYSTYWTGAGSTYAYLSGTSMATPHVAGAAALLAGQPGFDSPAKIRAALEATALDLGPLGFDWLTGHGLVQAHAALLFDPASVTPTPSPTPTYTPQAPEAHGLACPGAGAFDWVSATAGVNTNLREDDLFVIVDLPFPFVFDGYTLTRVFISSNGYLTFGDDATRWINARIPDPAPPNLFIAPYWDDLNPRAGGNIYYHTLGDAPARRFVVEWNAVPLYSAFSPNNGQGALTFQALLHEGSNEITFQYLDLQGAGANGASATIGVEYAGGLGGAQHAYNLPYSAQAGLAIRFVPAAGPTPTPDPGQKCPPEVYYLPIVARNSN